MTWASIKGYEGLYDVSLSGDVRNARSQRIIPFKSGKVTVCKNGVPERLALRDITPVPIVKPEPLTQVTKEFSGPNSRIKAFPWWNEKRSSAPYLGDAGETMVCSELLVRGIRATFNPMAGSPYDVIGDFGDGQLFTIQVKSTSGLCRGPQARTSTYRFSSPENAKVSCDIYAFVALDTKKIVFVLVDDVFSHRTYSEPLFNRLAETSIDDSLLRLYAQRVEMPEWLQPRAQKHPLNIPSTVVP